MIDEKATYQLTELFYKYLQEGNTGDVAIQKAKLEFIESNDVEYALPYYRAPTILIGPDRNTLERPKHGYVSNLQFRWHYTGLFDRNAYLETILSRNMSGYTNYY